jgi:hypothetical protein
LKYQLKFLVLFNPDTILYLIKNMQYDNNKLRQMKAEEVLKLLEGDVLNLLQNEDPKWDRSFNDSFNEACISKIPKGLKGIYSIHGVSSETMYLGMTENCIRGRLLQHLQGSSNRNLKKAISSGERLVFFCKESPDPKYEEALEIKRLKSAGYLQGQRREHKPLLESEGYLQGQKRKNQPLLELID